MNNTNKIQVFQNEVFGQVRIITKDGEPWFVGKEIAEKLGYSNSRKALADHVKDNHKNTVTIRDGITRGNPNQVIIDEAGFYSLVLRSKLPQAEQFQEWVTSEVLPAIRKHKMYLTPETAKEAIEEPSVFLAKAMLVANNVIDQQKAKLEAQAHQINQLKPKAKIYDKYMNAEDSYTITDVAVMNGVRPTDLFSFLKRINWLTKQAQCAYELTKEAPKEYFKVIRCFYGGCSRKTQIRVTATGFNAISSLIETAL
ncbi:BRO family protein [Phascolarctobacterium faecium]|uniref:BRO family protein n=1 Tax=Phascolarctobacterium faecium TaxID=33025 RepID=UPI003AB73C31